MAEGLRQTGPRILVPRWPLDVTTLMDSKVPFAARGCGEEQAGDIRREENYWQERAQVFQGSRKRTVQVYLYVQVYGLG